MQPLDPCGSRNRPLDWGGGVPSVPPAARSSGGAGRRGSSLGCGPSRRAGEEGGESGLPQEGGKGAEGKSSVEAEAKEARTKSRQRESGDGGGGVPGNRDQMQSGSGIGRRTSWRPRAGDRRGAWVWLGRRLEGREREGPREDLSSVE